MRKLLKNFANPAKLAASSVNLQLGVVNLQSGEFRTIDKSAPYIHDWVYASCAMPVFFDPLETTDKQQWVDGGVKEVTPLGAAMELNPSNILVIRASPVSKLATAKKYGGLIPIGLRSVNILQAEVSRNDLANTGLINDLIAARKAMLAQLLATGMSGAAASKLLLPLDTQIAKYRFVPVKVIEPTEDFSDTLEFDPAKIARAVNAGRAMVNDNWAEIEAFIG